MKRFSLSLSIVGMVSFIVLTGCSGFNNSEMSGPLQQQVSMGELSGSNYGGHAPIRGAHVYVFQVGTSGYSSNPTSLLTSAYTNPSFVPAVTGSTDGLPSSLSGAYSVTSDSVGNFAVSNYTCTAGYPVYLAGVGGSTSNGTPFTISSYSIMNNVITYNVPAGTMNAILYAGQSVTISSTSGIATQHMGIAYTANNYFSVVTSATPPTPSAAGSFTANFVDTNVAGLPNTVGTTTLAGGTGTPQAPANPSTINLAVLGNCPAAGNFYQGTTAIRYVYMNEVSTMSAALALGGFGTGPFTIGIPSPTSHPLALTGIANAANNAGQLYDITGSNQSTSYQGEGHIARPLTPAGNGIVPQLLLNTLGNVLASCVDSASPALNPGTGMPVAGTYSPQCTNLFLAATSSGVPASTVGTAPAPSDIATAAFNIAHHPTGPAGTSSATAVAVAGTAGFYMDVLYGLQGTNYPFAPALNTQPNDFTAAIVYPYGAGTSLAAISTGVTTRTNPVSNVESVGIDADGSVWVNSAGLKQIIKYSPLGVILYSSPVSAYSYGYLSIDPSGNVWTGNTFTNAAETEFTGSGASYTATTYGGPTTTSPPFNGTSFYDGYITVTDASGNAYVGATPPSGTYFANQWFMLKFGPGGSNASGSPFGVASSIPSGYVIAHGAVEAVANGGDVWFTTEQGSNFVIDRLSTTTGAVATGFPVTNANGIGGTQSTLINAPEMPSFDSTGNLWVANQAGGSGGSVLSVSTAGVVTQASTTTAIVNGPFGVAVDGAGNVWVADRSTGNGNDRSIIEYNDSGATISPTTNYSLGFGVPGTNSTLPAPLNLAMDQSGDLWITSYDGNTLLEMMGPGTPTYNPISTAGGVNKLGSTP